MWQWMRLTNEVMNSQGRTKHKQWLWIYEWIHWYVDSLTSIDQTYVIRHAVNRVYKVHFFAQSSLCKPAVTVCQWHSTSRQGASAVLWFGTASEQRREIHGYFLTIASGRAASPQLDFAPSPSRGEFIDLGCTVCASCVDYSLEVKSSCVYGWLF